VDRAGWSARLLHRLGWPRLLQGGDARRRLGKSGAHDGAHAGACGKAKASSGAVSGAAAETERGIDNTSGHTAS
jgi:hypothetical protein